MFRTNKKIMGLALAAAVALPMGAYAATTNIEATANFLTAITLGGEVNMDFGTIEFAALPGVGDTVTIGTDGTLAFAGTFTGAATGTAGGVDITAGTDTSTVEVFCDASATMTRVGGGSIDVITIQADAENATSGAGAGNNCNGVGGAAATTLVLNVGTLDTFNFGGQIDGATAAAFVAGSYSTANAGGDNIQVDVFYQ